MGQGSCFPPHGRLLDNSTDNSAHSTVDWSEDDEEGFVILNVHLRHQINVASLSNPPSISETDNTAARACADLMPTEPKSTTAHEVCPPQAATACATVANTPTDPKPTTAHEVCPPQVELSPGPEVSQKRKKFYSGPVVAQVLQHHHHALVKEIDPNEVAICLFRLGIIDDDEIESATNKHNSRRNRSNDLLLCLIRKLRSNPVWGNDAVVALKRAGVNMKSIATELEELSTESAAVTDAKKNTATTTSSRVPKDRILETSLVTEKTNSQQEEVINFDHCDHSQIPSPDQDEIPPTHNRLNKIPEDRESPQPTLIPIGEEGASLARYSSLEDTSTASAQSSQLQYENGNTSLLSAVHSKDVGSVRMLVNSDCAESMMKCRNDERRTVLHISTRNRLIGITAELLRCDACDPYVFDKHKKTPLHYACSSGMLDLVKPILNSKRCSPACVNATDKAGDTALHMAARIGSKSIVKLLLKNGADPELKNEDEELPIDTAEQNGNDHLKDLLRPKKNKARALHAMVHKIRKPLKRSSSCNFPTRAVSKTSIASQSQSELNYKTK